MVGKMPNVTWLDGSFVETIKGWQSGWFYITEPHDANWVAAPKFRSGITTWLTSWEKKGLAWGEPTELAGLKTCIRSMRDKKITLVNVVQVMLIRRILPCQRRAFDMWEFDPTEHKMLLELFGTTHKEIWKVLLKTGEVPPPLSEDRGLGAACLASPVSPLTIFETFPKYFRGRIFKSPC